MVVDLDSTLVGKVVDCSVGVGWMGEAKEVVGDVDSGC